MANFKELYSGKYLKAADVKDTPFMGVIERVETAEMQDKTEKLVVYFEGRKRGLVLNGTRYDTIVEIAKSHETDDWVGVPLNVFAGKTSFGGKRVDCICVESGKKKSDDEKKQEVHEALNDETDF